MSNPFIKGDRVYHKEHGACSVTGIPSVQAVNLDVGRNTSITAHIREVSFDPWPQPNHRRPHKPGWYIVHYKNAPWAAAGNQLSQHQPMHPLNAAYIVRWMEHAPASSDTVLLKYLGSDMNWVEHNDMANGKPA